FTIFRYRANARRYWLMRRGSLIAFLALCVLLTLRVKDAMSGSESVNGMKDGMMSLFTDSQSGLMAFGFVILIVFSLFLRYLLTQANTHTAQVFSNRMLSHMADLQQACEKCIQEIDDDPSKADTKSASWAENAAKWLRLSYWHRKRMETIDYFVDAQASIINRTDSLSKVLAFVFDATVILAALVFIFARLENDVSFAAMIAGVAVVSYGIWFVTGTTNNKDFFAVFGQASQRPWKTRFDADFIGLAAEQVWRDKQLIARANDKGLIATQTDAKPSQTREFAHGPGSPQ
ncbi:MAG: hypothetical protein AAGJ87_00590, partial [Pseudomonadota bacterium]